MEVMEVFMVEMMTGGEGGGVIAYGKPGLCCGAFREIVGCAAAAHFCCYPARVYRIR